MITLPTLEIEEADRLITVAALKAAGSIVGAAELMGLTRHAVKRRITKHNLRWHRDGHFIGQQPVLASVKR